jgi:hypothetical protein
MQTNTYLNNHNLHQSNSVNSLNSANSNNTDINQVRQNLGIVFPYERTSFRQDCN